MRLLLSSILLLCSRARADVYERASLTLFLTGEVPTTVERAVLQYDSMRLFFSNAEQWGIKQISYLGIPQENLVFTAIVVETVALQKFSTKAIHFYYSPLKYLTVRPDLIYNLTSGEIDFLLTFNWRIK